ncbi:tetratricopeptide repeat protein [Marilutibacter chinensis]|uniref:Tetratricopeptide repeat protein n=1 Tax=Marilutibacter chinensis TaxID=2912247 RepID=A0ABS9HTL4_9GAMM|nr:tetratricopeptide repeat protein [Lysobacter chinensis]MCF7221861.1 tetratricopeptide repeat protein [Lysobacter chinensis]
MRTSLATLAVALAFVLSGPTVLSAAEPASSGSPAGAAGPVPELASPEASDDPAVRALEPLLAAEFALQAGRLDEAAGWYLQAARDARAPALAERATGIALLAKDDARTGEALALWRELGGEDDEAQRTGVMAAEAALSLRQGRQRAARRQLSELLAMPGRDGWRQAFGVLATGGHDPRLSAEVLEHLVRRDRIPRVLEAWMAFGGLALRLDAPELVEDIVDRVIERFPGEPRVALLHAGQLREAGKPGQAREVLDGIDVAAADPFLRQSIANEYEQLGDLRQAERTLAEGPQNEQTYAFRASLLAQAEDKQALGELYDELRRNAARPDPRRRLLLGQIAEFLERHDEALDWYAGVPGGPARWQARLRTTTVLHKLGRRDEAYEALRGIQADAAAPDDTRRDAYLLEAALREEDENGAGELDAYARGLAAFPDEPEILYARALAWERRDDIARAEADFRKILVIDPESTAALNALGYTLADRTDRYREALELINRARAAEPENAAIIDSYGWVLYRLGRNEEAVIELRRALAMQEDAEIAAHLAEVLWVMGKRDEARRIFDKARALDPDNRSLRRALESVGLPVGTPADKSGDGGSDKDADGAGASA